jgi:hypothetical protein
MIALSLPESVTRISARVVFPDAVPPAIPIRIRSILRIIIKKKGHPFNKKMTKYCKEKWISTASTAGTTA